jgi:hypothetical protein
MSLGTVKLAQSYKQMLKVSGVLTQSLILHFGIRLAFL